MTSQALQGWSVPGLPLSGSSPWAPAVGTQRTPCWSVCASSLRVAGGGRATLNVSHNRARGPCSRGRAAGLGAAGLKEPGGRHRRLVWGPGVVGVAGTCVDPQASRGAVVAPVRVVSAPRGSQAAPSQMPPAPGRGAELPIARAEAGEGPFTARGQLPGQPGSLPPGDALP